MRKFNLERALAGDPIICRDGSKVIELKYFDNEIFGCQLIGIVEQKNNIRFLHCWSDQGEDFNIEGESLLDLFMAPTTKTYYVNLYFNPSYGCAVGKTHETRESAQDSIPKDDQDGLRGYLKTIEFTITE